MTGVAAGMCGNPDKEIKAKIETEFKSAGLITPNWGARHAVCGDLSPVASLISSNYNVIHDLSKFEKESNRILNEVESEFGWFYETLHTDHKSIGIINYVVWSDIFICDNCGCEVNFYESAVDEENGKVFDTFKCNSCSSVLKKSNLEKCWESKQDIILNEVITKQKKVPVLINYNIGKYNFKKKPTEHDLLIIEKASSFLKSYSNTHDRMTIGNEARRNDRQGITNVHQFFSDRTLVLLDILYSKSFSNEFTLLINSQLVNISLLNRHRPGVSFPYNPLSGTLYIGSQISEANVFVAFKNKLKRLISAFNLIKYHNLTYTSSATQISVGDNSIDYIFTDPPFGANIMYSELNFLQESWLKVKTNNNQEAVENRSHNKSILDYKQIMTKCFFEYYRILKPTKWMTVEFSNTSAAVWNSIQTSLQQAGFVVANVAALDKQQGSFKAVNTLTAVKQDLIISCYKPSAEFDTKFQQSQHNEVGIWDFIIEHLNHLPIHFINENTIIAIIERSPKILFDRLIAFYVQRNLPVPIDAGLFQKGLKERFIERDGMYFTAEQVHEYDSKKAEVPNFVQLSFLVASEQDGVMWLRRELVNNPQTSQDIRPKWMQALAGVRKGDILPELRDILEENFLQNESGAWYLPDLENEIDLEKVRTGRMLRLFATYREQASKPKGKIKEARVEALRAGFKQCYKDKDFKTIVTIGDNIPNNLLMEDEVLLQYYDIAISRV